MSSFTSVEPTVSLSTDGSSTTTTVNTGPILTNSPTPTTASVRLETGTTHSASPPPRTSDDEQMQQQEPAAEPEPCENSSSEDSRVEANFDANYPYYDNIAVHHTYKYPLLSEPFSADHEWMSDAKGNDFVYDDDTEYHYSSNNHNNKKKHTFFRSYSPPSPPVFVTQSKRVGGVKLGPVKGYTVELSVNRLYRTEKLQGICPPDSTLERMKFSVEEHQRATRSINWELMQVEETQQAVSYEHGRTKRLNDKLETTIVYSEKLNKRKEHELKGLAEEQFILRNQQILMNDRLERDQKTFIGMLFTFACLVFQILHNHLQGKSMLSRLWPILPRRANKPEGPAPPDPEKTQRSTQERSPGTAIDRSSSPNIAYKGLADYVYLDKSDDAIQLAADALQKTLGRAASVPPIKSALTAAVPAPLSASKGYQNDAAPSEAGPLASVSNALIVWSAAVGRLPILDMKASHTSSTPEQPPSSHKITSRDLVMEDVEEGVASTTDSAETYEEDVANSISTGVTSGRMEEDFAKPSHTESSDSGEEEYVDDLIFDDSTSDRTEEEISPVVEEEAQHTVDLPSAETASVEPEVGVLIATKCAAGEPHVNVATSSDDFSKLTEEDAASTAVTSSLAEDPHAEDSASSTLLPILTQETEISTLDTSAPAAAPAPIAMTSSNVPNTTSRLTAEETLSTATPRPAVNPTEPARSAFAKRPKSARGTPVWTGQGSQTSSSAFGSSSVFAQTLASAAMIAGPAFNPSATLATEEQVNELPQTSTSSVTTPATHAATVDRDREGSLRIARPPKNLFASAVAKVRTQAPAPVEQVSTRPQDNSHQHAPDDPSVTRSEAPLQYHIPVYPHVQSGPSPADFEKIMREIAGQMQGSVLDNPFTRQARQAAVPPPLLANEYRARHPPANPSSTPPNRLSEQEIRELEQFEEPAAPTFVPTACRPGVARRPRTQPSTTASSGSTTRTQRRHDVERNAVAGPSGRNSMQRR